MLGDFGYSIFGFLVAIFILVTIHEFGHFWVARKCGVKVHEFAIGFGRLLYSWRRPGDPTQYSIRMIPLGGYVRMLDEREGEVSEDEKHLSFNSKSVWQRAAIVVAGPAFNFIFAILVIWGLFMVGEPGIESRIGTVQPDSIAEQAGFKTDDKILQVDGYDMPTWQSRRLYLTHQGFNEESVVFTVAHRDGAVEDIEIDLGRLQQSRLTRASVLDLLGLGVQLPNQQGGPLSVIEGGPAAKAGIQTGETVIAIDGQPITSWRQFVDIVSANPETTMVFTMDGERGQRDVILTTDVREFDGKRFGFINVRIIPDLITPKYGPVSAFIESLHHNYLLLSVNARVFWRMITAEISLENLNGAITIARVAGHTAQSGYLDYLNFLALVSLSLGFINLLPIPVLDGGHLMFIIYEAISGKPPNERVLLVGQQLGLVLIVMFMSLALYNDVLLLLAG